MKRIWNYVQPYKGRIVFEMVLKLLGIFGELCLPYLFAYIIDMVVPQRQLEKVYFYGTIMGLIALVCAVIHINTNRMSAQIASWIGRDLRQKEFDVLFQLTGKEIDEYQGASLIDRISSDTYIMTDSLALMQRGGVRAPLLLLGSVLMMFGLDVVLALGLLAVIVIAVMVCRRRVQKGIRRYEEAYEKNDDMVQILREDLEGIRVIKGICGEEIEVLRFEKNVNNNYEKTRIADEQMAAVRPMLQMILYSGMILLLWIGALRIQRGILEPGVLIAFMTYVTMTQGALSNLMRLMIRYAKMVAACNRIEDLLSKKTEQKKETAWEKEKGSSKGLEFVHVSFSYSGEKEVLHDVSFCAIPGERIGIIGGSGSGKSTIIALMLEFYEPDSGEIRWNGREVRKVPPEIWRAPFAAVLQKGFFFHGTVGENIRFWRENLSENQIAEAVARARAEGFIKEKPQGMETVVEQGGLNFSGGQRQRLALSRAFAGKSEILLLDDSFSALDYKTEAEILPELKRDPNQIVFVISQRMSSLRNMDRLIVLEEGRIAGEGTPSDLWKNCPVYREIYEAQKGGLYYEEN